MFWAPSLASPTLSFLRMPCGPSAIRRSPTDSGAERRRKTHRRRWKRRPSCGKVDLNRWLSRSTLWLFRCNGTGMSSRGFFGRRGWDPRLPFRLLWQGWSVLGGRVLSCMSIGRCTATLTTLVRGILPRCVIERFQRHLSQEFY